MVGSLNRNTDFVRIYGLQIAGMIAWGGTSTALTLHKWDIVKEPHYLDNAIQLQKGAKWAFFASDFD